MRRESVIDLLLELNCDAIEHGASDERLAEIRERIHNEIRYIAEEAREEVMEVLER